MGPLLERGPERSVIDAALDRCRGGEGCFVLVEGEAGAGKTTLLAWARERARDAGLSVLSARAGELERSFAFGVARQLLEPPVASDGDAVLAGAARHALVALGEPTPGHPPEEELRALHGLHWLVVNLTDAAPLVLVVDDLQWADLASLRFLAYLARRSAELPLLVVAGTRPVTAGPARSILDELADEPVARTVRPGALSAAAVGALVHETFGTEGDAAFTAAVLGATRGNPFLVHALLRHAREQGLGPRAATAGDVARLTPPDVLRAVRRRVDALEPDAVAVADALAVLGSGATPAVVAATAQIDVAAVAPAAERLLEAGVLAGPGELELAHPLFAAALAERMGVVGREERHARAAVARHHAGDDVERVAAHVLRTRPELAGDVLAELDVPALLATAAERALARAAPDTAVELLRRAHLAAPGDRAVLHALARVELAQRLPEGGARYRAAAAAAGDGAAAVMLELVQALVYQGDFAGAAEAVGETASMRAPEPVRLALDTERQVIGIMHAGLRDDVAAQLDALVAAAVAGEPLAPPQQVVAALALTQRGRHRDRAIALATEALADPALWAPASRSATAPAIYALTQLGALDEARRHYTAMLAAGREQASRLLLTGGNLLAGAAELARGDLLAAESHTVELLDLFPVDDTPAGLAWLLRFAPLTMYERGDLAAALALLDRLTPPEPWPPLYQFASLRLARAELALADGRPEAAVADVEAGAAAGAALGVGVDVLPWRSALAEARRALGDVDAARALAAEELALAQEAGSPRAIARALVADGRCLTGADAVARMQAAVDVLRGSGAELDLAAAEVELGAALRRAGERSAARDALRAGVDHAARIGARRLVEQGGSELVVAGARPRRERLGGAEALTAAERRVVDLAAEGATNRAIAQALFLTQKTVETHLSNAYRKLDITSRVQLADALAAV